jgi:hypothetical protein
MDNNRIKFKFFLLKNLFYYIYFQIIISIIDSFHLYKYFKVFYLIMKLPFFSIQETLNYWKIFSYFVFSGLNLYLIDFV